MTSSEFAFDLLVAENPVPEATVLTPTEAEVTAAVTLIFKSEPVGNRVVGDLSRDGAGPGVDDAPAPKPSGPSRAPWLLAAAAVVLLIVGLVVLLNRDDGTVVTEIPEPTAPPTPVGESVGPDSLSPDQLTAAAEAYGEWLSGAGDSDSALNQAWGFDFDAASCDQVADQDPPVVACTAEGLTDRLTRAVSEEWVYRSNAVLAFDEGSGAVVSSGEHGFVDEHASVRDAYYFWLTENAPLAWQRSGCEIEPATETACVVLLTEEAHMNAWLATGPALPWAVVNVVAAEAAAAAEHVRAFLEGSEPFEPSLWAIEVGETTCELLSSAATTNRFRCTTSDQTDAWTRQLSAAWVAQSIHTVTVTDGVPVGNPSNGQYRDPLQAITDDYLSWLAATYTEGAWVDRQCALFYAGNPPCVAIFLADENVNTWLASEPPVLDLLAPLED